MTGARRPPKLSPEEKAARSAKIVKLWNQGVNLQTIKLRLHVSDHVLRDALSDAREAGVDVRASAISGRKSW